MEKDWKNKRCPKCEKEYRVQDLHICPPKVKTEVDELLNFMKGFKK